MPLFNPQLPGYERPSGPSLQVSSAVDTLMQATNQADLQAAVGCDVAGAAAAAQAAAEAASDPAGTSAAAIAALGAMNGPLYGTGGAIIVDAGPTGTFAISNSLGGSVTLVGGLIVAWTPTS